MYVSHEIAIQILTYEAMNATWSSFPKTNSVAL